MLEQVTKSFADEMHFQCPNCRNVANLDADVDEGPSWEESDAEDGQTEEQDDVEATQIEGQSIRQVAAEDDEDLGAAIQGLRLRDTDLTLTPSRSAQTVILNPDATDFIPASSSPGMPFTIRTSRQASISTSDEADDTPSSDESGSGVEVPTTAPIRSGRFANGTAFPPADGEVEGPLTPRNNAGPFVFDGAAGFARDSAGDTSADLPAPLPAPRSIR